MGIVNNAFVHMSKPWSKCIQLFPSTGHRLYADILINYIQRLLGGRSGGGSTRNQPRRQRPSGGSPVDDDEQGAALRGMGVRLEDALRLGLPPPLVSGNLETKGSRCFFNEDVKVNI